MTFHHTGGHAPPYAVEPDTLDAIRRDLDRLIDRPPRPRMTADDFGMGNPAHDPEPGAPQIARSIGMGPVWADLADAVDLASLAEGRRHHAYRMAADAVDHLIALMDALEADTEDMEEDDFGEAEPDGEDDGTAEPSLGAPENHPARWHLDMDRQWHTARGRWKLGSQVAWAAGLDAEANGDEAEQEAGYDLPEGDDDREEDGSDLEPSIGWPNDFRAVLSDALQADHDPEADDADLEPDGERMTVRRPVGLLEQSAGVLADRARAQKCGVALPGDGLPRHWLGADRVFGLHVEGDCCVPHILSHGCVHVDKEATPEPGDFVALWFEAERAGRKVMVGWVKRLAMGLPPGMRLPFRAAPDSNVEPVLMVDSLNPPRRYMLPASAVHAVFKVVRILPPAEAIATRKRVAMHQGAR